METPVPTFSVNALNAPPFTPLHEQMQGEDHLLPDARTGGPVTPWWTTIWPRQITREELRDGIRWLEQRLYRPAAFERRMQRFIELLPELEPQPRAHDLPRRDLNLQGLSVVRALTRLGPEEARMGARLSAATRGKPETQRHLFANLFRYMQIRSIYRNAGS